jgi:hypothetical protein
MASAKDRRTAAINRRFGPSRPVATVLARRLRLWSIIGTWMFILVFFGGPVLLGNPLFVVPAVIFSMLNLATMRLARRPDGPDAETLEPGELRAATSGEPVAVNAVWTPGARVRGTSPDKGTLIVDGTRIRFECLDDEIRFDAPIAKVGLATIPGFWRPQLDLMIGDVVHSIRFFPLWDLGATFVGPTVAGEWYAQLRELGAS